MKMNLTKLYTVHDCIPYGTYIILLRLRNDQNKTSITPQKQKETSLAARAPCFTTGPRVSSPPGPPPLGGPGSKDVPALSHRGLGRSPSRFATLPLLKSQKQHSYHRKKTREGFKEILYKIKTSHFFSCDCIACV